MIFACCMTVGGIFASPMTAFGDKIHYMNRDIKVWIYVAESIVAALIIITYILLMCLAKL